MEILSTSERALRRGGTLVQLDVNALVFETIPHCLRVRLLGEGFGELLQDLLARLRWEGWDVGIDQGVDDDWAVGGQGVFPDQ
ncbi:MAG: hypothetical protein QOG89_1609 [Thermomicrobiales bacterium]|nr:hypothetical protein [Thermomicrobiales bacterium]